ncbi:hypothetical protein CBS147333_9071 [Penicillium roqueforti]|nr:hypothetical protein CBS147333_9071 [Penicillium roqueforti]KAI3196680.1 hypothetical protein CBS147311_7284 [Penicillium roqueforti]KAI3262397.1 hypothetical protein CBS147308_9198 [Penicillium roqueforti]KAI3281229.1 hypothetical protein DTO003C3_9036 [Penicillium roqueforti]
MHSADHQRGSYPTPSMGAYGSGDSWQWFPTPASPSVCGAIVYQAAPNQKAPIAATPCPGQEACFNGGRGGPCSNGTCFNQECRYRAVPTQSQVIGPDHVAYLDTSNGQNRDRPADEPFVSYGAHDQPQAIPTNPFPQRLYGDQGGAVSSISEAPAPSREFPQSSKALSTAIPIAKLLNPVPRARQPSNDPRTRSSILGVPKVPESQSVTDASIASSSILAIRTVTTPAAQCHARKAAFAIPSNQATASSYIPKERKAGRKDLGLKSDLKYHECFWLLLLLLVRGSSSRQRSY